MMKTTEPVDTIGYRRVSKNEQAADWKASLRQQTEAITALARQLGGELRPKMIFEDRFSGETVEGRSEFRQLLAYCEAHPRPRSRPGYALFLNDSRFGRFDDPDEAAALRFRLKRAGWIAKFVENDDTTHTPTRHVLRAIGSAQASDYLHGVKENARRGARGAAELGLWQTEAPFGYRRLAIAHGQTAGVLERGARKADNQQVRLTPGPDHEVETIRWMFQRYADGLDSLGSLVQETRQRASSLKWSKQQVRRVLSNRVYLGEVLWCRRPHDVEERRETPVRPKSEWVVTPDAHEPLITPELFQRVQQRLAENKKRTRATRGGYPLSGIIRCAQCDSHYIGGGGRRGPDDDPDRYRFYKCSGGASDPPVCAGPLGTLRKRWVEPLVIGKVAELVSSPAVQQLIAQEVDRVLRVLHASSDQERERLEREKAEHRKRQKNLADAIAAGAVTLDDVAETMTEVRGSLQRIEERMAMLARRPSVTRELQAERERFLAMARDFKAQTQRLSGPSLRELLAPWIEGAVVDKVERTLVLTVRRVPGSALILEEPLEQHAAAPELLHTAYISIPRHPHAA